MERMENRSRVAELQETQGCPYVDLWSEDFNENYWETLKELRESGTLGIHRQGSKDVYLVADYTDMWKVHRDWRTYSSAKSGAILPSAKNEDPGEVASFIPLHTDPPRHSDWRQVVEPLLTL